MKKSPLYKGIGKYAKKTKGNRGFKMQSPFSMLGGVTQAVSMASGNANRPQNRGGGNPTLNTIF